MSADTGQAPLIDRLNELETKLAFLESGQDDINDVLLLIQGLIDGLSRDLDHLSQRVQSLSEPSMLPPGEEPPPPHY